MSSHEIQFEIQGGEDAIDPRSLEKMLDGLRRLMKAAGADSLVISDLSIGSVKGAVRERPGTEPANTDLIADGVRAFEAADVPTPAWVSEMSAALLDIHSVVDLLGADGILLKIGDAEWARLTPNGRAAVKDHILVRRESIGSVRGRIHRWTERKRREIGIEDETSGTPVTVTFPAELSEKVLHAAGRRVMVWGTLARDMNGKKVQLAMDDLEVLPDHSGPVTVEDLAGSLGVDWTGGRDSVEWVRAQRDEE